MQLKRLAIYALESWEGKGKGFRGELVTVSPTTEVAIRLSDESCRKILEIAGQGIVDAAKEQSEFLLQAATQLSVPAIEGSSND